MVYFLADGTMYLSVLFTFSLSIVTVYALQHYRKEKSPVSLLVLLGVVAGVFLLNRLFTIDYGFWGCMLPVFAALPENNSAHKEKVAALGFGLLLLASQLGGIQIWSVLSLPLLLAYSGTRGKGKMKAFFYIFYPVHLGLLQLIAWIWA